MQLSEEEKDKIRAEMEYRESINRELTPTKGKWAKFWKGCAHPIIITVLGGLLLAFAGALFQHISSIKQLQMDHNHQLQEKKYIILTNFSEQFNKDTEILYNIVNKQLFLKSKLNTDFLNRTREQVQPLYNELCKEYWENHKELAILLAINALFNSKEVLTEANTLYTRVEELQGISRTLSSERDSIREEEIKKLKKKVDKVDDDITSGIRSLAIEMGKEIKKGML